MSHFETFADQINRLFNTLQAHPELFAVNDQLCSARANTYVIAGGRTKARSH
ncbi:hypothetical protein ACFFLM_23085 [Deinococcus oregonensis]|uniref:Uncharacterized protein n=1 Tax=Deinococcus oregonensis TaxID=1805970 RepID=A0ABV6B6J0_9DEIO